MLSQSPKTSAEFLQAFSSGLTKIPNTVSCGCHSCQHTSQYSCPTCSSFHNPSCDHFQLHCSVFYLLTRLYCVILTVAWPGSLNQCQNPDRIFHPLIVTLESGSDLALVLAKRSLKLVSRDETQANPSFSSPNPSTYFMSAIDLFSKRNQVKGEHIRPRQVLGLFQFPSLDTVTK